MIACDAVAPDDEEEAAAAAAAAAAALLARRIEVCRSGWGDGAGVGGLMARWRGDMLMMELMPKRYCRRLRMLILILILILMLMLMLMAMPVSVPMPMLR